MWGVKITIDTYLHLTYTNFYYFDSIKMKDVNICRMRRALFCVDKYSPRSERNTVNNNFAQQNLIYFE